jgi:hypothetical protein
MLPLFNSAFASVLALAALLVILIAPFALLWLAFSMRRSLQRIADSLEDKNYFDARYKLQQGIAGIEPKLPEHRPVANSMFAR